MLQVPKQPVKKGDWFSRHTSNSSNNDSSGWGRGRKTSAKAIHLLVRPKATI